MSAMEYDAIIIGSGQAGFPLAGTLADRGWNIALAEGGAIGGTCINTGCSPTKTIVASARAAHMARRAADFGVQTGPVSVDLSVVMDRAQAIIDRFGGGIKDWLEGMDNLTIYRDCASFEGPNTVRVGDDVIEGTHIYINTGARAFIPPISGLDQVDYMTYVEILQLRDLPQHLVIIGGGYIGLEFAQAFRRFGSEVTVIEANPRFLDREDQDIADAVQGIMENEGVRIMLGAKAVQVEERAGQIGITVEQNGSTSEIMGSHLLVAIGRRPNSDTLALDTAGIETDERGYITVDDHLQTNLSHVWALGDVNGRGAFTHTSYNDYEILVDNLDGGERKVSDRFTTYALYIDPPLGRVGMNEQQVRDSGRQVLTATKQMNQISRAIERDETQGLMKVFIDMKTERFLGAAILGIGGDEVIHVITDMMYADASYQVMEQAMHIHPTLSELLPTLLSELEPMPRTSPPSP